MTNPLPDVRPERPYFSSGPCAKPPGWAASTLSTDSLGRSHRSKIGKARLKRCIDLMRADGADIVPLDLPGIERSAALQFATLCTEATSIHWRRLVEQPESLGEDVRVRLEIGQLFPALWYARAQGGRARRHRRRRRAAHPAHRRPDPRLR